MTQPDIDRLKRVANAAVGLGAIESAAIFIVNTQDGSLELGAAAGVDGAPLDRLVAAVQDPDHPIARAAHDGVASFDVTPVAPGGPALRSHLPLRVGPRTGPALGVLAVSHEKPIDAATQVALESIAAQAAMALGG